MAASCSASTKSRALGAGMTHTSRRRSDLVLGLAKQVAVVRAELEQHGEVAPLRGALCFVGTELPLFGERIGEVPLSPQDPERVAALLNLRFPAADARGWPRSLGERRRS